MKYPKPSARVREKDYFLRILANAKNTQVIHLTLQYASREEVLALAEVVANFLAGTIPLASEARKPMYARRKKLFRELGFRGKKAWTARREAAQSLGKVISSFLKDILPLIHQPLR